MGPAFFVEKTGTLITQIVWVIAEKFYAIISRKAAKKKLER